MPCAEQSFTKIHSRPQSHSFPYHVTKKRRALGTRMHQNRKVKCKVCLSFSHKLWPKFGNRWISRIGSLRFWWNSVQRKALMRTMFRREIFTKKCRQQQIFDSDLKGAWHYNHVTFTPIAKNFMLYCRLIYMLSILCVRLTIKVKVGIPESFKVGWYPLKKTGSSHLKLISL